MPPPAFGPRRRRRKNRVPLIVGGVAVLLALVGCLAVTLSGGTTTTSNTTADNVPAAPAVTSGAAARATTAAPPTQAAPKPLLTLKGSGIKKTAVFTTGTEWTLKYTYDCASFGAAGNFMVDEYGADGSPTDVLVNELQAKGSDSTPQHGDAGQHYLEVDSECSWTITVVG